jgi:hypothetical protein
MLTIRQQNATSRLNRQSRPSAENLAEAPEKVNGHGGKWGIRVTRTYGNTRRQDPYPAQSQKLISCAETRTYMDACRRAVCCSCRHVGSRGPGLATHSQDRDPAINVMSNGQTLPLFYLSKLQIACDNSYPFSGQCSRPGSPLWRGLVQNETANRTRSCQNVAKGYDLLDPSPGCRINIHVR